MSMASLRYAEGLGLDIPEANTATEIHLEIIYKMVFFVHIYICLSIYLLAGGYVGCIPD